MRTIKVATRSIAVIGLRPDWRKEENDPVPTRREFMRLWTAAICLTVTAWAQIAPKTTPPPESRVDINHASMDELMKVPGMTRSWAGRIVRFRPYRVKNDLIDHGVVTSEVYDRIKNYIIAHREEQ